MTVQLDLFADPVLIPPQRPVRSCKWREILMVANEPEDCTPPKVMVAFEIDHRPSAREIEALLLDGFHVSKAMRPEVTRMAMRIAHYAGDYYLEMAKLMRGQPQGNA